MALHPPKRVARNLSSQALLESQDPPTSGRLGDDVDHHVEPLSVSPVDNASMAQTKSPSAPESVRPTVLSIQHFQSSYHDDTSEARPNNEKRPPTTKGRARKRDMLWAATSVFLPILGISLLLLGFTFYGVVHRTFASDTAVNNDTQLPGQNPSSSYYYTTIDSAPFVLVGSWASNIALTLFTPFMLLFSFLVAWTATGASTKESPYLLHAMLRGNQDDGLWKWSKRVFWRMFSCGREREPGSRALHVAGTGFLAAFILSLLVVAAGKLILSEHHLLGFKVLTITIDTWLHITTDVFLLQIYDVPTHPLRDGTGNPSDQYSASYALLDGCSNLSPIPCSLNQTGNITNVAYTADTYLLLDTGITQTTSNYNNLDFSTLEDKVEKRSGSLDLVVKHTDNTTNIDHAFFFYGGAAQEFSDPGGNQSFGIDFVAQTTSVSTNCSFVTPACNIVSSSSSDDLSISYNCHNFFQGDLHQAPSQGLERVAGWNTGFYEEDGNGTLQNISFQTPANPFRFFVATALDSISFQDVSFNNPNATANGDVVDANRGRIAYVLDCSATVYDVNYTLIAGNITDFTASPSNATTAAIVRAPLQSSFGSTALFQKASIAVISTDPLLPQVELALSQVAVAGSFGAFGYGVNIAQRYRWIERLTAISKPALLFFIAVCLLYAALGLMLLIAAFVLRGRQDVRETQAVLLPDPEHAQFWRKDVVARGQEGVEEISSFDNGSNDGNNRNSTGSVGVSGNGWFSNPLGS